MEPRHDSFPSLATYSHFSGVIFSIVKDRKTQLNTHSPRSCRGTWQPGIFGKHDKSISDHCIVMLNRWWGVIGT